LVILLDQNLGVKTTDKRVLESWVAGSTHPGEQRVNQPIYCICIAVRHVLEDKVSLRRAQMIALISGDSLEIAYCEHILPAIGE